MERAQVGELWALREGQMLTSASFVELCRAQMALLVDHLGPTLAVVYLARDFGVRDLAAGPEHSGGTPSGMPEFVPLVIYPEPGRSPTNALEGASRPVSSGLGEGPAVAPPLPVLPPRLLAPSQDMGSGAVLAASEPAADRPLLLPLVWEGVVLGVLAIDRSGHPWNDTERSQLECTAQTLAIAGAMDQRLRWLEGAYRERERSRDRTRSLLGDLLHQFRNPLTAIRTFGKLLLRRAGEDDRQRATVESLLREAERLQGLLGEFDQALDPARSRPPLALPASEPKALLPAPALPHELALSPLESSNAAVEEPIVEVLPIRVAPLRPCELPVTLASVLASAEAVAQEQGLGLVCDWPKALPKVLADPVALVEVMGNLLDNAIKYSHPPEGLALTARASGTWVAVAVGDRGAGIPQGDQGQLFERGFRGEKAGGSVPGTGLGLALARKLVRAMGGELWVFSPPVGLDQVLGPLPPGDRAAIPWGDHGTTAIVRLRVAQTADDAADYNGSPS